MSFKITKKWLLDNKTKRGGYTNAQFNALGYKEPFKGWQDALIGRVISDKEKRDFEIAKGNYRKTTTKEISKQKKNGKKAKWLRQMLKDFPDFEV